ncbi:extracellular solute-binding protein [Phytoactinopolyspora halotolerans]|uniref:Sugar ABC transporter substrate-binding protein n=1 Tax=Phytoactinopolyspora halotolerans TaxID=1981512 RepID=A0A6L9SFF0_9ACTN|nr:extracellular solute-binding protein [Phytoactinopolyspora halotolerans]NEE03338.1 sugar ABC transporter substrate-binding protein [Phytoactinopolyspora halotolerans]
MRNGTGNLARQGLTRRTFLQGSAATGVTALAGGSVLAGCGDDEGSTREGTEEYDQAGIDWRAAEGQTINVAVIPATYFGNLLELIPEFEELTGISVNSEEIPPGEIRAEVIRDLSTGAGNYHTHAADPMYYPLYVANGWVDALEPYLDDQDLTNPEWFAHEDIFQMWREATQIDGVTYGIPYDGEVTVQVYRTDLFDEHGLKPAETFDEFRSNAEAMHVPDDRLWGAALRGFPGAGQNMYIYPSLFRAFGGEWFDDGGNPTVNSDAGVAALEYYVSLLNDLAPDGVVNWNWPDIADAFAIGTLGSYIDAHSSAAVLQDEETSVVADSLGFARWPAGPDGRRVTSIWNWSFPINAAVSDDDKRATWLFIQWATSRETQVRTSYAFAGETKRSGVNRESIWDEDEHREAVDAGEGFIDAALTSLQEDTDLDWRPRVPEWPAIGDELAVLIQEALTGQVTPEQAMEQANNQIERILES